MGLRRPAAHRQAELLVRTLAHRPPRHDHRPRSRPAHPPVRHLGSPAKLRASAENKPITLSSRNLAGEQITPATVFLHWLAQRQRSLRTCDQADIDTWHAELSVVEHVRNRLRGFLLWSMASKLTRPLRLPAPAIIRNAPLSQCKRMALLGQLLAGHDLPLRSRVAGVIVIALRAASEPARPAHRRRRHQGRGSGDAPPRRATITGPGTIRAAPARLDQRVGQHEHRHQPQLALAVPRSPSRPAECTPRASPRSSTSSPCPPAPPARPPSASTS
jgi:hypothetical protein